MSLNRWASWMLMKIGRSISVMTIYRGLGEPRDPRRSAGDSCRCCRNSTKGASSWVWITRRVATADSALGDESGIRRQSGYMRVAADRKAHCSGLHVSMLHNMDYGAYEDRARSELTAYGCWMTDSPTSSEPSPDDSTFEAGMRRQSELMRSMSSRESWDGESQWITQGRRLAAGALYFAAIVAIVLILWIASSLFLNT